MNGDTTKAVAATPDAGGTPDFDLTPDTRILRMLGEITFPQWRCIAELVDNSIDGFVNADRAGAPIEQAEVLITLPKADKPDARIHVRDNGLCEICLEVEREDLWNSEG
jgi:hypothetical protein